MFRSCKMMDGMDGKWRFMEVIVGEKWWIMAKYSSKWEEKGFKNTEILF